jgi:50S ribosomal protein L16 3-hydroxylase
MTYSIGFRAPSAQELAGEFLNYLQEHRTLSGIYADLDLVTQEHPSEIGAGMVNQVSSILDGLKWNDTDVADFLGLYLTEPKSHIVFDAPKNMTLQAFGKRMKRDGVKLSFKSQLLYVSNTYYLNGEIVVLDADSAGLISRLADCRLLSAEDLSLAPKISEYFVVLMHDWYLASCIIFSE